MAKTEHRFSGKASYLLRRPDKFDKYVFNFYPADAETRKAIKALGLRNSIKEDEQGGLYYRFKTFGPIKDKEDLIVEQATPFDVRDAEGKKLEAAVGNGSDVDLFLEVESFTSPTYGECTRSTVTKVVVTNLIPYEKKEATATVEQTEVPTD